MASFIKVLKQLLRLVLVLATGMLVWNFDRLTTSRKYQHYRKALSWKLTNDTKSNLTDVQYLNIDTGNWEESKISKTTKFHQLESTFYSTESMEMKSSNHTKDPWSAFPYPLNVDMVELVRKLKSNIHVEHKPLFVYQYNFKHYRIDKCVDGSPFFIFLIKSAVNNVKNRVAIRETWSHLSLMEKYNSVRLFLVGTPDKQMELSAVEEENNLHKDIILMSFRDNYYNNTLKTIGAIHWTVQHCNRSKFVVFVDDDMLVSTTRLVKFLKSEVTVPTFFGGYITRHSPYRGKRSKWYVSPQDYPHDVYPPMPSAGFMIMTMNFVTDLHFASQFTRFFNFDDCYLGILAYKLHVKPVYIRSVYVVHIATYSRTFNLQLMAAHGYPPSKLKSAWRALQKISS
ncbi:beta-1,3-galactosyltransferase 5-like [Mizuhopecten yessoensis]|uniref:Hexosyltransferase n=1 Tax=Mizuhopecten yessoensis TaxID=6573 RepID=A0A210QR81_MIZYE|nr:beta-1,3-galactosyltransferase 5-like [Mizuhopecten yessoensis]XP_021351952.1 beta-1,3-galactosyltransferase 5-like [Mizuhopecten yessoensis]OWF51242.1 Beta-1,3-galactosyltransferase brn [Mizuhopecten yessoensis]